MSLKNIKKSINDLINDGYNFCKTEEEIHQFRLDIVNLLIDREQIPVGFQELSDKGLIYKINEEVLHPHGLSLTRDIDLDLSYGCVISHDGIFEYDKKTIEENEEKYKRFLESKNKENKNE